MKLSAKFLMLFTSLLLPGIAWGDSVNILAVPYSNPNFSADGQLMWNSLVDTAARSDRNFRIRAILNPDSGPGRDAKILSDRFNQFFVTDGALAQKFIDEGGELIGYVSTRGGEEPLAKVIANIDEYLAGTYSGKVTGIFLDDFFNNPDSKPLGYYLAIYSHIQTNHPGTVIIGNAGNVGRINGLSRQDALSLISPLSALVSHEMAQANYENSFTELEEAEAFGNSNLSHLIHTAEEWDGSLLDLALERNVGWFYATLDDLSQDPANPWDEFNESYWNGMVNSVIEANTVLKGDVNQDGSVNFSDISPFISILSNGGYLAEADINRDNAVNFVDISPFISLLSAQ